jgi:hypothetical protein
MPLIHVNDRQHACILAALRVFQLRQPIYGGRSADIEEIETNGGTVTPLSAEEIDWLCEDINCSGDKTPPLAIVLEGGLVQDVLTANPKMFGDVVVIDYDTEGADDDEITKVPQGKGKCKDCDAIVHLPEIGKPKIDIAETIRRAREA